MSSSSSSGHARNASTYISAEAGRPSSSSTSNPAGGLGLTQRSPSPSPTRPTFAFNDPPGHSNGPIPLDKSLSGSGQGIHGGAVGWASLTPQRVGKAIGGRFMRAVRRGNLPFLLVFFSCTIVFFSALAGVGYHEPLPDSLVSSSPVGSGAEANANPGEFRVGGPVFDDRKGLERRIAEQRALEEAWAKKRRPKDGAWMRKQRDDKAIRRKPALHGTGTITSDVDPQETVGVVVEGGQGLAKRGHSTESTMTAI
ncbi:hypothetical protein I302_102965 [Kwoniella bestiolae CBS 10118]|uniref:Uncharacterized protein n=1 Tax=Kwoniella bestiolae CBS 10118 TaxID=1296100 RepID=A0A1B9GGF5_9TREE|nr:hypothetical protein I302_01661 [Kwoniella bestiolae CBS 10118]OCF30142.1 hypothetical protein I302_01661 [Kwoniella bestiolae CBS 10118]